MQQEKLDNKGGNKEDNKIMVREDEIIFDLDDLKCLRPGLLTRILLWLAPQWGVKRLAREMGYPLAGGAAEHVHELFAKAQRVDVLPAGGFGQQGGRGFQLVLDGSFSLYFSQDGDHFAYDGYEIGEYERGDVNVFDEPADYY